MVEEDCKLGLGHHPLLGDDPKKGKIESGERGEYIRTRPSLALRAPRLAYLSHQTDNIPG